jgi:hypothetical protein
MTVLPLQMHVSCSYAEYYIPCNICLDYNINRAVGEVAARSRGFVLLFHIITDISSFNLNVGKQAIITNRNISLLY